jgi:hypothetical protein
MLTLLKAEEVLSVGLTITQVFYLVGREASKKLCRFVGTNAFKCAVSTLLGIKDKPSQVQDIRMTDGNGLRVWTSASVEHIPSAEAIAFFTRYNQLARYGCASECTCSENPQELWKQFCVHRIAGHLAGVKEKIDLIIDTRRKPNNESMK